jgi:hypothetical protein
MNEKRNFFISHFTLPFYIRNTCNWLTHKILKSLRTTIIAVAVGKKEIRVGETQQEQQQQKLK